MSSSRRPIAVELTPVFQSGRPAMDAEGRFNIRSISSKTPTNMILTPKSAVPALMVGALVVPSILMLARRALATPPLLEARR